ncbi:MAG: hypothetical protein QSU88_11220, partial [Candidatus Methanoperedens sp.]|nr:hypothetical protein [Candidatus Methanoperedens sp.]
PNVTFFKIAAIFVRRTPEYTSSPFFKRSKSVLPARGSPLLIGIISVVVEPISRNIQSPKSFPVRS